MLFIIIGGPFLLLTQVAHTNKRIVIYKYIQTQTYKII
jgi:hypothetical protein